MSAEQAPPPEIGQLLADSIRSIEELELLLRLRADGVARRALQLAEALSIPDEIAASALHNLERAGLLEQVEVEHKPGYAFAPRSVEQARAVDVLVAYYRDNRMQVIMTISNNAIERMRHGVLRLFSDAFRISRDKNDG